MSTPELTKVKTHNDLYPLDNWVLVEAALNRASLNGAILNGASLYESFWLRSGFNGKG